MNTLPASVTLAPVDFAKLNTEANNVLSLSKEFIIESQDTYALAGEELIAVKTRIKVLEEKRSSITKPLTDAHKATMDLFRVPLGILEECKKYYEREMITFTNEQERLRAIEQKRLDDLARIEKERLEQEAKKLAAVASKATGGAAILIKQQLEDLELQSRSVVAVTVENNSPVAQGNSVRKTWKAECTDILELAKFVIANPAYIKLLQVDQSVLNATAKAQQDSFAVGGCRAFQEASITSRTK